MCRIQVPLMSVLPDRRKKFGCIKMKFVVVRNEATRSD